MSYGYMYILECADGSYYTGSTIDLNLRLLQHQTGFGAYYTKQRLPVKLLYYEEYARIDEAFNREKQVQGWSRKKKQALINGDTKTLPRLAECQNGSHYSFCWRLRSGDATAAPIEPADRQDVSNPGG